MAIATADTDAEIDVPDNWMVAAAPAKFRRRMILLRVVILINLALGLNYLIWRYFFSTNLHALWFGIPMIIAETSSTGEMRPRWLRQMTNQCLIAMKAGVDLHGLCIYPVVGMADWNDFGFVPMGLWDRVGACDGPRIPHEPTLATLRSLQERVEAPIQRRLARAAARVAAGMP